MSTSVSIFAYRPEEIALRDLYFDHDPGLKAFIIGGSDVYLHAPEARKLAALIAEAFPAEVVDLDLEITNLPNAVGKMS